MNRGWLARRGAAWLALAAMALPAARAQDAPSLSWSGYGTVGLIYADNDQGWRYSRELMQPGADGRLAADTDTRVAVQANAVFTSSLDGVAQVLVRDRYTGARASDWLHLGFLRYSVMPDLAVSLGRTSPDIFLYANTREVGLAMPWVRPPVEFYGWIPFESIDGGDLNYRWRTDSADWRASFAYGGAQAPVGVAVLGSAVRVHADHARVLSLTRESGGLLLKASYVSTDARSDVAPTFQPLVAELEGLAALPVPGLGDAMRPILVGVGARPIGHTHYLGLGVQYDFEPWHLDAEWSRVSVGETMASGQRGYLSLSRRFGDWTAWASHAWTRPRQAPVDVPQLPAGLLPPTVLAQAQQLLVMGAMAANVPRMNQQTTAVGLRWDVTPRVALKFQLERVRVGAYGAGHWVLSGPQPAHATVTSLALDFAWGS